MISVADRHAPSFNALPLSLHSVTHFSNPSITREKFNLFREIRAIIITITWTEN
jgi:hypothetical protein